MYLRYGTCEADVEKSAVFAVLPVVPRREVLKRVVVGEPTLLQIGNNDRRELQPLGIVQGHQIQMSLGAALAAKGSDGERCERALRLESLQ